MSPLGAPRERGGERTTTGARSSDAPWGLGCGADAPTAARARSRVRGRSGERARLPRPPRSREREPRRGWAARGAR
ncbi:hypothetical protein NN561_014796 [Cricetulus griseus]